MKYKRYMHMLFISFILYIIFFNNVLFRVVRKNRKKENKNYAMLLLNLKWIYNLQAGKYIGNYLLEKGFKKVAIYGMGDLGRALLNELNKAGIIVSYVIDKNAGEIFMEIPIITPDSTFESVDVIIVTPFLQYESIKEMLQKKINCPVLSIADIINNV